MSHVSPPNNSPASTPSSPRYRGVRGALIAGLLGLGVIALMGGLGAVVIWLLTSAVEPARQMFVRFVWFGVAVGAGAAVQRLIHKTESNRLPGLHRFKGDMSGTVGLVGGLFLAGYLAEHYVPAPDANDKQPAIGQAMEIAGPTSDGGRFDLADHRGKIVLVDFWASWCGPCIAELPNVRAVYDKHHANGLDVVAVSLDFKRTSLTKYLDSHPEPWPQIFFDKEGQRGFDNPLAKELAVQAIPYLLVIDRDGKLAARSVRGPQIKAAVAEALGLPVPWSDRVAAAGFRLLG